MIRWITNSLGTAAFEEIQPTDDFLIIDVRDLVDKAGNIPETIKEKIEQGTAGLKAGRKVIVCCDHGISRSNAVAAAILHKFKGIAYGEALRRTLLATGMKSIRLEVISAVSKAIETQIKESKLHNDKKRKAILLTGGTGDVGRFLIPILKKRYSVFSPSREELCLSDGSVLLDLFIKENGIDTILHLAHPKVFSVNAAVGESVALMKNVLDVCVNNQVRLIYPSSIEVYSGYRSKMLFASESLPKLPRGPFGESKYLCEKLIELYEKQFGLDCTVIRTGSVYGDRTSKPKFLHNFLRKIRQDENIVTHKYKNGLPIVDFIHEEDLALAYEAVIGSPLSGDFNFGWGIGTSTAKIAEILIHATKSKSIVIQKEIDDFSANVVIAPTKAIRILGWRPNVTLETGLFRVAERFS